MSNYFLGWVNNLLLSSTTVSSFASGLNYDQLSNDQGSAATAWQTSSPSPATLTLFAPGGSKWRGFGLFRTNLTTAATATVTVRNGGGTGTIVYTGALSAVAAGYGQMVGIAPSEVTGDWCQFSISDVSNPDGFYNIPLAFAGPGLQPALGNLDYNSAPRRLAQLTTKVTRAGGVYARADWNARSYDGSFSSIRVTDLPSIQAIEFAAQQGSNMLFVPDPAASTINVDAIFGRVEPQSAIGYKAFNIRSWRILVTERL